VIETQMRELSLPKSRYLAGRTRHILLYRWVLELRQNNGQCGSRFVLRISKDEPACGDGRTNSPIGDLA
jgi:hypothetical protein